MTCIIQISGGAHYQADDTYFEEHKYLLFIIFYLFSITVTGKCFKVLYLLCLCFGNIRRNDAEF